MVSEFEKVLDTVVTLTQSSPDGLHVFPEDSRGCTMCHLPGISDRLHGLQQPDSLFMIRHEHCARPE